MGCPDLPALDCALPGPSSDRKASTPGTRTEVPSPDTTCPDVPSSDSPTPDAHGDGPIDLLEFLPLVRSIASRIYASLPPYAAVELNDLMQSGHLGLVNAGRAYQSGRQVPFAVYARFRIRGEILDSLRHLDTATRRMRRLDKRIKSAKSDLRGSLNRDPTDIEVHEKLHAESAKPEIRNLDITLLRLPAIQITSLDDRDGGSDSWRASDPGPDSLRSESEARYLLGCAIKRLPHRSRQLIHLYYQGGLTMREIGTRFNVNESRISQIHRRALERMALYLRNAGVQSSREI